MPLANGEARLLRGVSWTAQYLQRHCATWFHLDQSVLQVGRCANRHTVHGCDQVIDANPGLFSGTARLKALNDTTTSGKPLGSCIGRTHGAQSYAYAPARFPTSRHLKCSARA